LVLRGLLQHLIELRPIRRTDFLLLHEVLLACCART
jgi:hypothetical protein